MRRQAREEKARLAANAAANSARVSRAARATHVDMLGVGPNAMSCLEQNFTGVLLDTGHVNDRVK